MSDKGGSGKKGHVYLSFRVRVSVGDLRVGVGVGVGAGGRSSGAILSYFKFVFIDAHARVFEGDRAPWVDLYCRTGTSRHVNAPPS